MRPFSVPFAAAVMVGLSVTSGPGLSVDFGVPAANALPASAPPSVETQFLKVENRLLPRFFGGRERRNDNADAAVRLEQLEAQVRSLTGQVEELTFAVRQLQEALRVQQGTAAPQQRSDTGQQLGDPPRTLGTLPAPSGTQDTTIASSTETGPLDLSVLNDGARISSGPDMGAATPAPVRNEALAQVRDLQASGRYSMAAQEARKVLQANPSGPVAGEARYLLGEALLAQREYRAAANLFLENYTSDPNGARAPASLLRLGTALNGLGEREAACSSLEELLGAYPNVDASLRAEAERERQSANCA
ncbi:MAG: tetratricopeptide repeat protein [Devosia sp.]